MLNQNTHQYPSRYLFRTLQSACILSASFLAQSAIAAPEAIQQQVEEVVVTAAKREQLLKDFSGSISVVKTDALNPGATLSDVANQVPGFTLLDNGPLGTKALVMRGLRMDSVTANDLGGDGATVATYVDNIPLQGFFSPPSFSLKDLQQIEIVRGPQGTLYGNASVAGLIRYITAKPDLNKFGVNVNTALSQTDGNHDLNYDTDVIINSPLIENELAIRLLLGKEKNQGFIDNPYLLSGAEQDINDDDARQIRTSVLWKPTDKFSLGGSYHYQKIQADDRQASNEAFTQDDYTASSKYKQPMTGILKLASIDTSYQFDAATLTASINSYDYTTQKHFDYTDFLLTAYGADYYALYPEFSAYEDADIAVEKESAELRLASPDDQPLRWLAGVFFSKDDLDVLIADTVPGFASLFNEHRPNDLDMIYTQVETLHEESFYNEISYDIKPEWEVTLGGRVFRYGDELATCTLFFPTASSYIDGKYPLKCVDGYNKKTGGLGKFSTRYKINPQQTAYFTVAEGFRRGGANALPAEVVSNRSYKPDTSVNYELGAHSDFFAEHLQLNAALFYMDWKEIQLPISFVENGRRYRAVANAGTAKSEGIELEVKAVLTQELGLQLNYTLSRAQLSESVDNINGAGQNVYNGDTLPGSPRHHLNLGIDYSHVMGRATFKAGINSSYLGGINTEINKEVSDYAELDGYTLTNVNAGIELRDWRFGLFVNNIANTRGVTAKRTSAWYGEEGQFEYITRPRTIGLSASYQF